MGKVWAMWRCVNHLVVRAAVCPVGRLDDLTASPAKQRLDEFAAAVAGDEQLAAGLAVAQPEFWAHLCALQHRPAAANEARVRRMVVTLASWQGRARWRSTPHGLAAGAAIGQFGAGTIVAWRGLATSTSVSGPWLEQLAAGAETDPEVLRRLRVTANPLVRRRGDRLVCLAYHGPHATATDALEGFSVRASAAVDAVLRWAADPIAVTELCDHLRQIAPTVPAGVVLRLVTDLVTAGVLITDLLPPPGHPDPPGHMLDRLPATMEATGRLRRARDAVARFDVLPAPDRLTGWARVQAVCTNSAISGPGQGSGGKRSTGRGATVDVALNLDAQLPAGVAREAQRAAALLWRYSPARPAGWPVLAGWREAFIERYGLGQPVPVLDVLDEVTGIAFPSDAGHRTGPHQTTIGHGGQDGHSGEDGDAAVRARLLTQAAVEAARAGDREVDIEQALAGWPAGPDPALAPPSVELHTQLLCASPADLDRGAWRLAVQPHAGSDLAGSAAGRHTSLLGEATRATAWLPTDTADTVYAELVWRPSTPEMLGIAAAPGWLAHRIPIGVADGRPGDIPVTDLAVVAEPAGGGDRLRLLRASTGRRIIPLAYTRASLEYAPPIVWWLRAVGGEDTAVWMPWRWEAAADLPYRPRLGSGRLILAPASWNLPTTVLAAAAVGDRTGFAQRLAGWRERWQPPAWLLTCVQDRRIPVCLDDAVHRDLLARECRRGLTQLTELPGGHTDPAESFGWLTDPHGGTHVSELVISLTRTTPAPPVPPAPLASAPSASVRRVRGGPPPASVPGGEWLSVAIPAPPRWHDDILTTLATTLVPDLDQGGGQGAYRWFFLRYADAAHGPHLRLRIHHTPGTDRAGLAAAVHRATTALVADGLAGPPCWIAYRPEITRYGGRQVMTAAEDVFTADSRCALAEPARHTTTHPGPTGQPGGQGDPEGRDERVLAAAGALVEITTAFTLPAGMPHPVGLLPVPHLPKPGRAQATRLRSRTRQLPTGVADLGQPDLGQPGADAGGPGGAGGLAVARAEQLARYAALLRARPPEQAGTGPAQILAAVAHMACNRLGLDRQAEHVAHWLAADALRAAAPSSLTRAAVTGTVARCPPGLRWP